MKGQLFTGCSIKTILKVKAHARLNVIQIEISPQYDNPIK